MAYVRGQERFVYEQVVNFVRDGLLTALHWDGSGIPGGGLPWGASKSLKVIESLPEVKLDAAEPNTVAISEGPMPAEGELELGGGLVGQLHTIFVDVYAENHGLARSLGGDVKALFDGRAGISAYRPLLDWANPNKPPLVGHHIYFEDTEMAFPGTSELARTHWVVVKTTVVHEFAP